MAIFLIIILAVLVFCFAFFKIGDAFSPWMLTSVVWLGIFVMFQFLGDNLFPLQNRLYNCVSIWIPVLTVSSLVVYYAFPDSSGRSDNRKIELSENIYMVLFVISMVCSPLYLYQVIKVVLMFDTQNLLNNIRILSSYGEKDALVSLLKYVNTINQTLFVVELWRYPNGNKWRFAAIIAANLFCAFAIMSKTPIFILFISTLYVLYEKKKVKLSTIFFWGIIIIGLFFEINELRKPEDERGEKTFLDFFSIYVLSPSVAFEWAQEKLTDQFGSFSFAFFYAFASKLGLGTFYVQKQLQDFVFVPMPTNVYTVFQPYFEDFGYKGVAFFASLWGVLTGFVYRMCRNGHPFSRCMYAYFVFALVMQFYQESLFVNLSVVLQYAIFFFLILGKNFTFALLPDEKAENTNNKTKI